MITVESLIREAYSHWDDPEVLSRTGRELQHRNRLEIAREVLERAVELAPENVDDWAHLSFAYYRGFMDEEGSNALRRGIEATGADDLKATLAGFTSDEEESKRLSEETAASEEPGIRSSAISQRFWKGDKEALDEIRELLEANPDESDVRDNYLWMLFHGKNRGMLDDLDLREVGVPHAERKIEAAGESVDGYWLLAQMYVGEKDWNGALAVAERVLGRFPDEETFMQLKGRALRESDNTDRAVAWLNRAIGAKPSFAGARIDLGKLYEEQGNFELAEEVFREIPVANPEYGAGPLSLALFLGRQGRLDEAEKVFRAAWPDVPQWYRASLAQNPDAKPLLEREAIKQLVEGQ